MGVEHIDDIMIIEKLSFNIPWSRNAFFEEIQNNNSSRYLVAKFKGRIAGYIGMWKVLDEGHITNIAVHPEYRGNGIGSLLLEGLVALARTEEISSLTLEVRRSNKAALHLYGKYGFEVAGNRKGYYADNGEDAIIMWKNEL